MVLTHLLRKYLSTSSKGGQIKAENNAKRKEFMRNNLSERFVRSSFVFTKSKANTCLYKRNKKKMINDCCHNGETLN